jgi:hypothetical protein
MSANYFYNLPDEIVEIIGFEVHKKLFKNTLDIIVYAKIASAIYGCDYVKHALRRRPMASYQIYWVDYENDNPILVVDAIEPTTKSSAHPPTYEQRTGKQMYDRYGDDIADKIYKYNLSRNLMSDLGNRYDSYNWSISHSLDKYGRVRFNLLSFTNIFSKLYACRANVEKELATVACDAAVMANRNGEGNIPIAMAMARASWADMSQQEARQEARQAIIQEKQARRQVAVMKERPWRDDIILQAKFKRQSAQWVLVEAMKVNKLVSHELNSLYIIPA